MKPWPLGLNSKLIRKKMRANLTCVTRAVTNKFPCRWSKMIFLRTDRLRVISGTKNELRSSIITRANVKHVRLALFTAFD